MLFNVWHSGQSSKTTIKAEDEITARQIFATRYGWLSDMTGYWAFIYELNVERVQ